MSKNEMMNFKCPGLKFCLKMVRPPLSNLPSSKCDRQTVFPKAPDKPALPVLPKGDRQNLSPRFHQNPSDKPSLPAFTKRRQKNFYIILTQFGANQVFVLFRGESMCTMNQSSYTHTHLAARMYKRKHSESDFWPGRPNCDSMNVWRQVGRQAQIQVLPFG